MAEEKKEIRGILRIAGTDVKGEFKLAKALTKIKGIGIRLGKIIAERACTEMKLRKDVAVGELSDEQIEKIEEMISRPLAYGVPNYIVNRQKERESGEDRHLVGTSLSFAVKQDIEFDKNINTWRGYRHAYGQKVRGQHTRSTGRTGMSVGVLRKAILAKVGAQAAATQPGAPGAAAPAAKEAAKEEKKPVAPEKK